MATPNTLLKTPEQVLSAARYKACYDLMPYVSIAIHNCIPQWAKGFGTIAISEEMHLLIDPDQWMAWYRKHGLEVMAWVLIHEVNHPLREHMDRARRMGISKENAAICNACEDAEINDDFPDPEKCLPEGFCWLPSKLGGQENGKMWEEYFANLPTNESGQKYIPDHAVLGEGRSDLDGDGDGDSDGDGDGDGPGNAAPEDGGTCGSGATGHPLPGEPPQSGQSQGNSQPGQDPQKQPGQPQKAPQGRSPADIERIRNQVAEAVQQHIQQHGAGSVPAGMSRWAQQRLKPPTIPWHQQIRRASRFCVAEVRGQMDYDYKRPSRRQAGLGYGIGRPVLPRMFSPIPKVDVAVDTSGSMGDDDLLAAMGEVEGIMKALGVPVDLYTCDAAVHVAKKVTNIREACAALVGGGGTDFRPIFEAIKARGRAPDILAIFTDGDGPAPTVNPLPRTRIIWVIIEGSWGSCVPYTDAGNEITYGSIIRVPAGVGEKKAA